jgi:hypothetical protein
MSFDINNLFTDISHEIVGGDLTGIVPEHVAPAIGVNAGQKIQLGCAPGTIRENGTCFSNEEITKLRNVINAGNISDIEVIEKANVDFGCKNNLDCIGKKGGLNLDELKINFVPHGPLDNSWLSNFDIMHYFEIWMQKFNNFIVIEPQMNDFERHNKELAKFDWLKFKNNPERLFMGCIINTDNYGSSGQHWVAIVADNKGNTIEYFDSAGGAPSREIMDFMERVSSITGFNTVYCNQVKHQQENSECGVYCIYYILCRFHNVKPEYFLNPNKKIGDDLMYVFRFWIFRSKN